VAAIQATGPASIQAHEHAHLEVQVTAPGIDSPDGVVTARIGRFWAAAPVIRGVAAVTLPLLPVASSHSVDVTFDSRQAEVVSATSAGAAALAVLPSVPSVGLGLSASSAPVGQTVTAVVAVSGPAVLGVVDQGTATLSVAGVTVSAPVRAGIATLAVPTLPAGTYWVSAEYRGAGPFGPARSAETRLEITVPAAAPVPPAPAPPDPGTPPSRAGSPGTGPVDQGIANPPAVAVRVHAALKSIALAVGASRSLVGKGFTSNGAALKVTWTSSNTKIATVTKAGRITAKKPGKAKLTLTAGAKRTSITLTVVRAGTKSLKIARVSARGVPRTMNVGAVAWLTGKYSPARAQGAKVTFTSSAPGVITADRTGRITAVGAGKATITVKAAGVSKKYTVRVREEAQR
jgi:hypothetical protein